MFTCKIATRNDAFAGADRDLEVSRMLRHLATRIESGAESGRLQDSNGNTVGSFTLTNR